MLSQSLIHNKTLIYLNLSSNNISKLNYLTEVLHKTSIQDLELSKNNIDDKNLEDFIKVLRLNSDHYSYSLQKIDLSKNQVILYIILNFICNFIFIKSFNINLFYYKL